MRDEFNIENARYHKVVLMTDADVDGAHIRTLVLTLLFREMEELIKAGYVYIAKPPLYKLKQGSRERYIEKEAELEEILLTDKWEKLQITDRHGAQFKLTDIAGSASPACSSSTKGWASSLRAAHGHDMVQFLEESTLLGERVTSAEQAIELLSREGLEGETHATELLEVDPLELRVKAVETRTGFARTHRIKRTLFDSQEYRQLAAVHQQLIELAGTPAFEVQPRRRPRKRSILRGAAPGRFERRPEGRQTAALQGARGDERRAARRNHDGATDAHAGAGHARGRRLRRQDLLDADGRPGRAAPRLHRG